MSGPKKHKRLGADEWQAARLRWQADPLLSFEALAQDLGVSRVAVSKRAKQEGWEREASLPDIAKRAQFKADQRQQEAAQVTGQSYGKVTPVTSKKAAQELAEDIRADVIERHRADWVEHRLHYPTGEIAADFDLGKSAKISAEMLAIRQKGERAAYGLDDAQASSQAPSGPDWTALVRQKAQV